MTPDDDAPLWQHLAVIAGLVLIVAAGVWRMWWVTA